MVEAGRRDQENIVMFDSLRTFLRNEEGLTMVEYAVAGALISAASVAAFTDLGKAIIAQIGNLAGIVNG
jgi:pilus assembly protein Flp/PilA